MFIVWRRRPVTSDQKSLFLQDDALCRKHSNCDCATPWKPLYCTHRGDGRTAWTPLAMHAERREDGPRQKLLHRFPTIRSCCIADGFNRATWWHDIEQMIQSWESFYDSKGELL